MQSENKERGRFFSGDPSDDFRGFGLFGSRPNLMPSLFRGKDPFDDPFFNRSFDDLLESNICGPSEALNHKMLNNQAKGGIVIEELDSDGDGDGDEGAKSMEEAENQRHDKAKKEPSVLHPDDVDDDRSGNNKDERVQFEPRHHSVHTCKVTYGGVDGAYFTSTRTRKSDSDGAMVEETKEADRTKGQAKHRISRGIHSKGHSVTRMLNSDGKVETLQTLHNLSPDDLAGFDEAWKASSKEEFSKSKNGWEFHGSSGSRTIQKNQGVNWGGFLSPSSEHESRSMGEEDGMSSNSRAGKKKNVVRINID